MKLPVGLLIFLFVLVGPTFAEQKKYKLSDYKLPDAFEEAYGPQGMNLDKAAQYIQTTTAIAISPLLVVGIKGLAKWYKTPEEHRESLSLINRPWVWGTFLGIGFFFIVNSFLGTLIPPLKKPLDLLEPFEHMISGFLIGLPIVVSMVLSAAPTLSSLFAPQGSSVAGLAFPAFAATSWASVTMTTVVWTLTVVICFISVWSFSQFMNLLIVLSPWGGIDLGIRLCKGFVLIAIIAAGLISPWLAIFLCGLIILITLLVLKFTLRASRYLFYLMADFVMGHFRPHRDEVGRIKACALSKIGNIKKRTIGWLDYYDDGKVRFNHVGGKYLELPGGLELREGFLGAIIFDPSKEKDSDLFRISKRYRLKYIEVAQRLQLVYSPPAAALQPVQTISDSGTAYKVDYRVQEEPLNLSPRKILGYIKYAFASYMRFGSEVTPVKTYKYATDKRFYFRSEEERQKNIEYWSKIAESGRQIYKGQSTASFS
jgi:hypothetical protein